MLQQGLKSYLKAAKQGGVNRSSESGSSVAFLSAPVCPPPSRRRRSNLPAV